MVKNHGYIHSSIPTSALVYGGLGDYAVPDRDWRPFLPEYESQLEAKPEDFETMACVTFAALNCIETSLKKIQDEEFNFSDRFTAKMSGTTNQGNTLWSVMQSISTDGFVKESVWSHDAKNFIEYYKEIPQEVVAIGNRALSLLKITPQFVPADPDVMYGALGNYPLQIAIHAYAKAGKNGIHPRSSSPPNHSVMISRAVKGKYFEVYDHYNRNDPYHKIAWDTLFWGVVLFDVKKNPIMLFKENHIYQLVDPPGGFYLFAKGIMMKIETADHVLAWLFRAGADWSKKTVAITAADLEEIEIYDFKGKRIGKKK